MRLPIELKPALDRMYTGFNAPNSASDPIQIVRRFTHRDDQEVVGFCAGALAFGRVSSVLQSIERVVAVMGESPGAYVRRFDPVVEGPKFAPIVHRWIGGRDLVALLWILRQMLEESGSLENFFLEGHPPDAADVGPALDEFSRRALAFDLSPAYGRLPKRPGVCYFFPRPSSGSACKRLNLFLRWMVRKDALDLGTWTRVPAGLLVVPLDTHIVRLGQCLRLTRYSSPGWRMAADITRALRAIDPVDPVKYDFSLCHLGMMGACGFKTVRRDTQCPLRGVCRPRGGTRPASRRPSSRR
jgi:uncharacterized protein (TIGR02757 family)